MLLDFNFTLVDLQGKEIQENGDAWFCIASVLSIKTNHIKAVKAYEISMSLVKDKKIEVTIEELDLLIKEIDESNLTNLAKGQIINFMKKQMIQNG